MDRPDLGNPTPWRRSLRASQDRRAAAARSRCRALRSRTAVAGAVLIFGASSGAAFADSSTGGASADAPPSTTTSSTTGSTGATGATGATAVAAPKALSPIRAVQKALHVKADGAMGPKTRAAIRRYEKAHRLKVNGRITPALLSSLGVIAPTAQAAATGEVGLLLARIAACESGDNPTAVSADGRYRGKYQFTQETWESMGGTGDPAAAPEATQDQIAAALYAAEGLKPWPVCGQQAANG